VAAAGCDASDTNALLRLADAALEIRERCTALFEAADLPAAFRIGLDHGIAIGSSVGRAPRLFNLWGEAFRSADEMAASGMLGSIQVTEAAFRRLRREFLFRQRGSFYLPRIGAAQTFILAGRI
jgi:adenylate cyclase